MNCGRHGFWPPPCARARTGGGSPMSRPSGSNRHRVQSFSVKEEIEAAQGALLSGTPRRRVRAQDGGSSVCVYREVQVLKKPLPRRRNRRSRSRSSLTTRSLEIQAIATTAPDLPPVPGRHASFARDHEYKRHAARSAACWPGSICSPVARSSGARQGSPPQPASSLEFLKLLGCRLSGQHRDQADPSTTIPHTFRGKPGAWLDTRPPGRFDFTFTPKHGSWLNLIEGFFSKFARSRPAPYPE